MSKTILQYIASGLAGSNLGYLFVKGSETQVILAFLLLIIVVLIPLWTDQK